MHFKLSRKTGYLLLHVQTIISEVDKDHNILQYLPWILNSQQKIFIEYIMLDGVNDQEENAHQLGELLKTFQVVKIFCFLILLIVSAIIWCESLWRFLKKKTGDKFDTVQPNWVHKPVQNQHQTKRLDLPEDPEGNLQYTNHGSQRNGSGY